MKNIFLMLLGIALISCDPAPPKEVPSYDIEQFFKNTSIRGGYFSPDENRLAYSSDESGIFNVYEIALTTGDKKQLTQSTKESFYVQTYVPGTNQFIYSADKGGNEISHLYLQMEDGTSKDLTPGENEKAGFYGWSKDRKHLYYTSNKRDSRYFDLYKMAVGSWEAILVYENTQNLNLASISNDERYFVLSKSITTSENKFYLLDNQTQGFTELSEAPGSYGNPEFSDDSTQLFYITDVGKEFSYLVSYDIQSQEKATVYETNWDVMYSYLSEKETYRVIGINEDGKNSLVILNNNTGATVGFPEIPDGEIRGINFSKSEANIRLTVGSSKMPSNLYVFNFETEELKKMTDSLNPDLDADNLVSAQVVRYPSFDGLKIPAIFYKPLQATKTNKLPALVWVHGGPGGQSRANFSPLIQYLVNQGYAVLAVNNRGSSGYGKTFYKMDDQNHGDKDLKDCIWGKKWLQSQNYIDAEKIGIIGGSYGGYMTMAAMTFTPEEFNVGVNIFGVTNWLRTLKSIPSYWEASRKALYLELGDPFTKDSVRLREISPLFHAERVKNPVMVLQGANDPRVLQVESDEIVAELKKNNIPVEYVIFPDEGHGFRKKDNQIKGYGQIKTFLDTHLIGLE